MPRTPRAELKGIYGVIPPGGVAPPGKKPRPAGFNLDCLFDAASGWEPRREDPRAHSASTRASTGLDPADRVRSSPEDNRPPPPPAGGVEQALFDLEELQTRFYADRQRREPRPAPAPSDELARGRERELQARVEVLERLLKQVFLQNHCLQEQFRARGPAAAERPEAVAAQGGPAQGGPADEELRQRILALQREPEPPLRAPEALPAEEMAGTEAPLRSASHAAEAGFGGPWLPRPLADPDPEACPDRATFLEKRLADCLADRRRYFEQYCELRDLLLLAHQQERRPPHAPAPFDMPSMPSMPSHPRQKGWKNFWSWLQHEPQGGAPADDASRVQLKQLEKEKQWREEERQVFAKRVSSWEQAHYALTVRLEQLEEVCAAQRKELDARRRLDTDLLRRLGGAQ